MSAVLSAYADGDGPDGHVICDIYTGAGPTSGPIDFISSDPDPTLQIAFRARIE